MKWNISEAGAKELVYLGDVATVKRGFKEVPNYLASVNGREAITLGISFAKGYNVVNVGERIKIRLDELELQRPIGIELEPLYNQPTLVSDSIQSFIVSLAEAVAIVIAVLLLFMGMRSGLLIGFILLLTVVGSFVFMKIYGIHLQRI